MSVPMDSKTGPPSDTMVESSKLDEEALRNGNGLGADGFHDPDAGLSDAERAKIVRLVIQIAWKRN
jgi:hypothetical protein